MTSFVISSFELPVCPEDLLRLPHSATVLTGLGPVIDATMLAQAEFSLLRGDEPLYICGLLRAPAWQILTDAARLGGLHQYLRPVACSFTELALSDVQIRRLPGDPALCDLVLGCYIGNLLADFARLAPADRLPPIQGFYWSLAHDRLVECAARERQLTPSFGQLSLHRAHRVSR